MTQPSSNWGTFQLTDEPLDEPPRRLHQEWQRRGFAADRCHVPPVGGVLEIQSAEQP